MPNLLSSTAGRQHALVTGVGRRAGIGAAICRELASRGVEICFSYWPDYDRSMPWADDPAFADDLVGELTELGVRAVPIETNLALPETAQTLIEQAIDALGPLDMLVNNAAHSTRDGIDGLDAAGLDAHYAVNLRATALLTAAFTRHWRGGTGGRIINLTSGQSLGPMSDELAYAATKGAVEALTVSMAPELARRGITINAVNPGPTDTGWIDTDLARDLTAKFPTGRLGQPADVARLVGFLTSEAAGWITGQIIHSEGGFTRS